MELHTRPAVTIKRLRRLGQGHGSGRGKTAGRGTKGQKARGTVPQFFEGGALPLIKRLPFLRGRGRNKSLKKNLIEVNVEQLSKLPAKTIVDIEGLIKYGIVDDRARRTGAKILGRGNIDSAFTVKLPTSSAAREKIERAGGTVS